MTDRPCTCAVGSTAPVSLVPDCPRHGRAGAQTHDRDAVGGVPVVDLTASTKALLERADWLRVEALNLITTAVTMRQHAEQLEELVATLQGAPHG